MAPLPMATHPNTKANALGETPSRGGNIMAVELSAESRYPVETNNVSYTVPLYTVWTTDTSAVEPKAHQPIPSKYNSWKHMEGYIVLCQIIGVVWCGVMFHSHGE